MSRIQNRYKNYEKSLNKLKYLTDNFDISNLDEITRDSLIKRFELTFELSWNLLKDFLEIQGETDLYGSRDTFKIAFQRGLISNGETWLKMIESRVLSSHSYDEENAIQIATLIEKDYIGLFIDLLYKMKKNIDELRN